MTIMAENPYRVGKMTQLADGLGLILAPNPSPMTYWGTNTYLLGTTSVAVIDPGPDNDAHLAAILRHGAGRISHIIVTHSHVDHSALAPRLAAETGATIYAYGPTHRGRSDVMSALVTNGLSHGGEGIDRGFSPDLALNDGDVITGADWSLRVVHTPGHLGNHLCLVWGERVFTGDHVMAWASSLVSPPDGDLTDFMASCSKLQSIPAKVYHPGHGLQVMDPAARLQWLIDHRLTREAQIRDALVNGPQTPAALTAAIYHDILPALQSAALRNVLAHLIDLHQRGLVSADPTLSVDAEFSRKN
jgi:glyoxylase-like metal-dependent hydrolase (beta-lactamase superfamily II)